MLDFFLFPFSLSKCKTLLTIILCISIAFEDPLDQAGQHLLSEGNTYVYIDLGT